MQLSHGSTRMKHGWGEEAEGGRDPFSKGECHGKIPIHLELPYPCFIRVHPWLIQLHRFGSGSLRGGGDAFHSPSVEGAGI